MKYLVKPGTRDQIVTVPVRNWEHGNEFEVIATGELVTHGVVAEVPDSSLLVQIRQAMNMNVKAEPIKAGGGTVEAIPFDPKRASIIEAKDFNRDLKWLRGSVAALTDGAEVSIVFERGGRMRLVIPESARPERPALKKGDRVAFNASASPKYLLNARATVVAVNGSRATVEFDKGDAARLTASTGKPMGGTSRCPVAIIDVIDEVAA